MEILNDVLGYKNIKIIQDSEMFNFTLDSILIARFAEFKNTYKRICDFGTNNAIVPIIISKYTNAIIDGVEIQKEASVIANKNIVLNNLENKIYIINDDIKEFIKEKNNFYDLIFSNPPFFKLLEGSNLNKINEKLIPARHELTITLEEIIRSAAIGCRQKGRLILIHLAERFDEIVVMLNNNNFKIKRIQFVYSREGQDAKKVLIDASYKGNDGVKILKPLYVHKTDSNDYTDEVKRMFED